MHVLARSGALVLLLARALTGQDAVFTPHAQWELRTQTIVARTTVVSMAAGVNVPAGTFLRVGLSAGAGSTLRTPGGVEWRADVVTRYLLDPFREVRRGLYAGAGLTMAWGPHDRARADLLVVAGIEGPDVHGWRPSAELGLGGGARAGLVFRRARRIGR